MKNKKTTFALLFILIFTLLYLVFATRPLGKEYHFEPEWETSILSPTEKPDSSDIHYFKLSNKIGYFDNHGHITQITSIPENHKASISENFYCVYPLNAEKTDFFNKTGFKCGTIDEAGFPYFIDDRIFIFLPGGGSVSRCDNNGKVLWLYEGIVPITSFASKTTSTAIGFADGTIKVFNTDSGEMTLEYAPGGSDQPVILGLDITEDGHYIASISGQDKQRFVLAHKENTQVKIVHHNFLPENYSSQCLVHFTEDEKTVFYNYKKGIGIYNLDNEKNTQIKIDSRIISIEESENMVFFMGKDNKKYTIYIIEKSNSLGGSFSFTADSAFICADRENLYVGKNNSLSKINISKK
ncbi:MAG: hypothetical protein MJ182_10430 [Treponema sp.]|nr:hypothetical protein [Treponema sp.]